MILLFICSRSFTYIVRWETGGLILTCELYISFISWFLFYAFFVFWHILSNFSICSWWLDLALFKDVSDALWFDWFSFLRIDPFILLILCIVIIVLLLWELHLWSLLWWPPKADYISLNGVCEVSTVSNSAPYVLELSMLNWASQFEWWSYGKFEMHLPSEHFLKYAFIFVYCCEQIFEICYTGAFGGLLIMFYGMKF